MFRPRNYKHFKHPDDPTFGMVLEEGRQKLDKIIELCPNKRLCIQAGGNLGIFPHYLAQHFQKVLTFEPCPETLDYLHANIGNVPNVIIREKGLSNRATKGEIVVFPENHGANYMEFDKGDIRVTTIDRACVRRRAVDLIYLDIEGAEVKALNGARITISEYKPVIVIENKGLIPEYGKDLDAVRKWICRAFQYEYHSRLMKDDIFVPKQ